MPYMLVTFDVSKLSGSLNADASCAESKAGHTIWGEMRPGERKGVGRRRTGRARWKAGGQGTRETHVEHIAHISDAGCLEAQRLVERRRLLPSRKESILRGTNVGREAEGFKASSALAACTGPRPDPRLGPGHAQSAPKTCRSYR